MRMRLIMRLASRTFRDFHTCELERCMLAMKMLIKPFVKSLQMWLYLWNRVSFPSPRIFLSLYLQIYVIPLKKKYQTRGNSYNFRCNLTIAEFPPNDPFLHRSRFIHFRINILIIIVPIIATILYNISYPNRVYIYSLSLSTK